MTRFGPPDMFGAGADGQRDTGTSLHIRAHERGDQKAGAVQEMKTLITLKEKVGCDKDRAMLSILRRTLEEGRKREDQGG